MAKQTCIFGIVISNDNTENARNRLDYSKSELIPLKITIPKLQLFLTIWYSPNVFGVVTSDKSTPFGHYRNRFLLCHICFDRTKTAMAILKVEI